MLNPQTLGNLLIGLLLTVSLQAQTTNLGRTYQDQLPPNFKLSIEALRTHIHNGLPKEECMENFHRQILRFSDINAVSIAALMESGDIYSDWPAMDTYLNNVLQRVIPDELKEEKMIKAYLVKDGNFNAYMRATGHMFINVGIFELVEDEATLAGIMAHEIGHYYLRHGFETFVKAQNREFELRVASRKVDYLKFSVNNELDCDSLSLIWLQKAGYNFKGAIKTMEVLKKIEENQIMKQKDVWEITKSTHPRGKKRVAKLQEYAKQMASKALPNYIVGEDAFNQLRKEAKTEIVKHLLHSFQYADCIESAFRFHLEDVENTTYLYYLMEAIRRAGMMDNNHWSKKFITHQYYIVTGDKEKKVKIGKHIFEDFFPDILLINQSKFKDLPAKFYWEGDPKFITNEQAFEFFAKVGELLKEPECTFSNALSMSFDPEKYKPLLKEYLNFENIRFRDFAKQMLNGTLRSSLENNSIAVVNDFSPVVKQGDEYVFIRDEDNNNKETIKKHLAPAFLNYSSFIYLPDLIDNQLNDFSILQEMSQYSRLKVRAKGQRINPHLLDPRFWEAMKRFNVNEFDFVELDFRDVEKNIQTLESYQNIINFNTKSYLEQVKRDRYIRIGVFSIRVKQNNIPKIIHFSNQRNLKYKETIFPQLTNFVKEELEFKSEKAKEIDARAKKVED